MKHRLQFTAGKLLRMALLLLGVSLVTFLLVSASPLDPLQTNVGQAALGAMSQEQIGRLEEYWGAGEPLAERYIGWLTGLLHGDMGMSLLYRQPVLTVIGQRLSSSLLLLLTAWGVLGRDWPPSGDGCGLVPGALAGPADPGLLPSHLQHAGLLACHPPSSYLFRVAWMAAGGVRGPGRSGERRGILPGPAAACHPAGSDPEHHRRGRHRPPHAEKMVDVLESEYILFARARGESGASILWRHGLRGVALPAITLQFGSVSEIIGGSVLVEQVFSYPGLGQAAVTAASGAICRFFLGITLLTSAVVFGGNLLADLLYGAADPKIRRRAAR